MTTLLDNDVVLKSARFDLLNEIISNVGGIDKLRILSTLYYRFDLADNALAIKYCKEQAALDRMRDFVGEVAVLECPENNETIARLNNIRNLDPGEVLLFAYNIWRPGSVTFTGDKRAILALAGKSEVQDLTDVIRGHVKCLEQVIAEIILAFGFTTTRNNIVSISGCDKAISLCFRSDREDEALAGLLSYYQDLNTKTGGLLAPFPQLIN